MSKREMSALGTPATSRPDSGTRGKEEADKFQLIISDANKSFLGFLLFWGWVSGIGFALRGVLFVQVE